ncbi:hypothetical protein VZT92_010562 [Zoarces viviparus]|uniref:Uncharacterized protein n=1 Tax=Zoarces viviparus TaxID=48416 RepID=A0AAW1F8M7_ZOAVI
MVSHSFFSTALGHIHTSDRGADALRTLIERLGLSTGQEVEVTDDQVQFPFTSEEEVELFELPLKDPSNSQLKKSVISSLATIGGHDTKQVPWNIMPACSVMMLGRASTGKG